MEHLSRFGGRFLKSRGHNLALTVLYVPHLLDSSCEPPAFQQVFSSGYTKANFCTSSLHPTRIQVSFVRFPGLSDTMSSLISLRESTPPQNRQLNISISNSKQCVDDLMGELTVLNLSTNTLCEKNAALSSLDEQRA